jgi:hypothetical protein
LVIERRNGFLMPQHTHAADTARLHVPGRCAEPVRTLAELARRPARTTDTDDLSASVRFNRRVGRVLNLCEGGMLVQCSSNLEVGQISGFELAGPGFRYVGFAAVAHRADAALGLRFVTWEGPIDAALRSLVTTRLHREHLGSHTLGSAAARLPTLRDSQTYDHGALSGLSMLIEQPPDGVTSRYQVLNVRERGILIDGLGLPLGAQISFVLAGRDINHAESGRVAYRTDTATGVAVDPWHDAPQAIRALISGETKLGARLEDAYITDWS